VCGTGELALAQGIVSYKKVPRVLCAPKGVDHRCNISHGRFSLTSPAVEIK